MIGVFDSGLGGLTLVREIAQRAPDRPLIYLGDTARFPYGTKSRATLIRYSIENARFLLKRGARTIVIACNSASAMASDALRKAFPKILIFDVVEPAIQETLGTTRSGRVGVIGTRSTIASGVYPRRLRHIDRRVRVFEKSCPLFAPLVEEGWLSRPETYAVARTYLFPLKRKGIDTLILACTHYPLLLPVIRDIMGRKIHYVNPAAASAEAVLKGTGRGRNRGKHVFFATDDPRAFAEHSRRFLGREIRVVRVLT